jgi:hypothetical protein
MERLEEGHGVKDGKEMEGNKRRKRGKKEGQTNVENIKESKTGRQRKKKEGTKGRLEIGKRNRTAKRHKGMQTQRKK